MRHQKITPRTEYRQQEGLRTQGSATLSEEFQHLKPLTAEFSHFSPDGVSRNRQINYTAHPAHAKSVFRFDCLNDECIRGDFDLSEALTQAVTAGQTTATGELCCQGCLSEATIDRIRCHSILRYTFRLGN